MAEMLCTRLCHDLTGPIGAVNNGAEFLSEEGFNLQNQAVELITSSAFSAVARLQFYRMAYGRVKEQGEAPLSEYQQLAADFFQGTRVTLDWPDEHADAAGVSVSFRMVRLIFNLLVIASAALLKGGTVTLRLSPAEGGGKEVLVSATGEAVKWEEESASVLLRPLDLSQVTPKNVQLYVTRRLAEELGAEFDFKVTPQELSIHLVQRPPESGALSQAAHG